MRRYLSGRARPIPPKILMVTFVILLVVFALAAWRWKSQQPRDIKSFKDCAATGAPILESYPEQCIYNGRTYFRPGQEPPAPY